MMNIKNYINEFDMFNIIDIKRITVPNQQCKIHPIFIVSKLYNIRDHEKYDFLVVKVNYSDSYSLYRDFCIIFKDNDLYISIYSGVNDSYISGCNIVNRSKDHITNIKKINLDCDLTFGVLREWLKTQSQQNSINNNCHQFCDKIEEFVDSIKNLKFKLIN